MSTSLLNLFAAAEEHHRDLPMPPLAFGLIALAGFFLALGVLWSFRGTANKIAAPGEMPGQQGGHH
jgi:hypothetical protein